VTELPTGTVTFLFTDIEGSTRLLQELSGDYRAVQDDHMRLMREAVAEGGGTEIRTEGDAFFVAFASAQGAIHAAVAAQRAFASHPWSHGTPLRVRMGMHTGEGVLGGDDYLGIDVNRAARIAAAGHGGQVLLSDATKGLAGTLRDGVSIRDLGRHRLKDFDEPVSIHQLVIEGLPDAFPPLRTLEVPTNLPVRLTAFVGREREVADLQALMSKNRLVTLVGPGGTGKTRLSVELAGTVLDGYPDGVFFVDLSPIRDPELVPSTIATALELKEGPQRSALETVNRFLAYRRVLLLLDNFEQVVSAASAVEQILQAVPNVTMIVTSRTRLGLMGEQAYPVPPLAVPTAGPGVEDIERNEAVALFLDRARAILPGFEVTAANAEAIATICARLDGLPLAIELAVAQLRMLSPAELLGRLEHRLPLRTGAANVPERQRTLRTTIEWSDQLLDGPEQRLFARLSVFAGGASLTAIEAVGNPEGDLGADTVDALTALFDQSLIRRVETAGGSRYTMLETIREYAAERLDDAFDGEDTRVRHAEFFAGLAQEWGLAVRSKDGPEVVRRLELDHDNIRAAIDWSMRRDRADLGLRVAAPMWMFWVERGNLPEGRRALEALLELPSGAAHDLARMAAFTGLGGVTYWQTDYAAATRAYAGAVEIARELGNPRTLAQTLTDLGYAYLAQAQPEPVFRLMEEATAAAKAAGDDLLVAVAVGELGLAHAQQGDYESALKATTESLDLIESSGGWVSVWAGEWKGRVGSMLRMLGRVEEAEQALLDSLTAFRLLAGNVAAAAVAWQLSVVSSQLGKHERAVILAGFADAVTERIGGSPPRAVMLLPDIDYVPTAAREVLDEETIERLWNEGRAMEFDHVIAWVLGETSQ
jgi:predicted ATPase/class 3 adenylate cyclase